MRQAIFYILSIISRLLFLLFSTFAILSIIIANITFVFYIYKNQFDMAFLAICVSYFWASILTFCFYYIDKNAARKGNWRVPEQRLHKLELIGGWIGALIAQKSLRHKNKKASYQLAYWVIVIFHLSLSLLFLPVIFPHLMLKNYVLILNGFLLFVAISVSIKR
jgi:uncharacterized membrane protein YsdA (DUF1294 family)